MLSSYLHVFPTYTHTFYLGAAHYIIFSYLPLILLLSLEKLSPSTFPIYTHKSKIEGLCMLALRLPIKYCISFFTKKVFIFPFHILTCISSSAFINHLVCIAAPQDICHGWLTAHSADLQQQLIISYLVGGDGSLSHRDE